MKEELIILCHLSSRYPVTGGEGMRAGFGGWVSGGWRTGLGAGVGEGWGVVWGMVGDRFGDELEMGAGDGG